MKPKLRFGHFVPQIRIFIREEHVCWSSFVSVECKFLARGESEPKKKQNKTVSKFTFKTIPGLINVTIIIESRFAKIIQGTKIKSIKNF